MAERLKNAARRASAKIARYQLRKNLKQSPAEAFKLSWEHLLSNPLYRLLVRLGQSPSRAGTQLKGRTFEILSQRIPNFYASTEIQISSNLKRAIEDQKPFLAIHIHDGHRFLSRVLINHKRHFTRIASDPDSHLQWLSKLGSNTSYAHVIKDDLLCLARLRKAAANNHVLCCAIDYKRRGRDCINPAALGFANVTNIPVFFIKANVTDDGVGELIGSGPHAGLDPLVCAAEFLEFFNSTGESRTNMRIRRYKKRSEREKRKRTSR